MKKLSLAYFGTPYFSALFLEKLLTDKTLPIEVKLVVTQPDRPVGRKQIMMESPVKIVAKKYRIEIIDSPNMLRKTFEKIDLAFLFAYGEILPEEILNAPKLGFWNTHPSFLPKYRGAAPIAIPLILGDKITGVTLIKLDQDVDHGPIIAQEELEIAPTDKRPDLEIKLTQLAFGIFKKSIDVIARSKTTKQSQKKEIATLTLASLKLRRSGSLARNDSLNSIPQDHESATFTRLLTKDDGFIPFEMLKDALSEKSSTIQFKPKLIEDYYRINSSAQRSQVYDLKSTIYNLFRGLHPWPGLWTRIQPGRLGMESGKRLKITDLALINNKLVIKKVQLEGKKEVDFVTFNRTYSIF